MTRKNRQLLTRVLLAGASVLMMGCATTDKRETEFITPPSSVQTGTYWYWIDGNVTKEGVEKDLEAMKAAGIDRAFMANIGGTGTGDPNAQYRVKFMSDEWWNITRAALKKATELGIDIGIFNSPGWSQSGGPWIKANQTMRYLNSSRTVVKGPGRVTVKLPQPADEFEDVKVVAFPNPTPAGTVLTTANASITSAPMMGDLTAMTDGDNATDVRFTTNGEYVIEINPQGEFTARSIVVRPAPAPINTDVELQAMDADGRYELRKQLNAQRLVDAKNGKYETAGGVPDVLPEDAPQFVKDYHAYYKTPRGYHKRSLNSNAGWNATSSLSFINMPLMSYSDEIRSAVLIVHGELAHSRYFGEDAFKRLKGDNKELLIVPGASHTDLYDNRDKIPFDRIVRFFQKYL